MSNTLLATLLASSVDYTSFSNALQSLISSMWVPLVGGASALAVVWGLYLGLKFWLSAGDENKRKEAKSAIISFVVGTVVIFAVAVCAPLLIAALSTWVEDYDAAYILSGLADNTYMQYLAAA